MSDALREVIAFFGIDVDDKELKKGEKSVGGFTETLKEFGTTLAGAFAVHKIIDFSRELLNEADVLAKQSQALGVSAEELQGWQWAAKLSGSSAEEFSGAFTKFTKNMAGAKDGTGPAADALKALGFDMKNLKDAVPLDMLDGVADGLVAMQDPAKRTEAIMALFGKSGAKLLPLFLEGAEGVKKLRAEVKELGAGFDDDFLENAQEVNDNLDRLEMGAKGLAIQAIGPLLPDIVALTQAGIKWVKWLVDVMKHSNALKAALITFGIIGIVKTASGLMMLAQKAGFLQAGFRGLLLQLLPLVAAFLVLEDLWTFFTGGKSATGNLIAKLFGKEAPEKVRAFAKALAETGITDFGNLLKAALSIFTSDKPLSEKFRELAAYIRGPFLTQMVEDFGAVGKTITIFVGLLNAALQVLTKIMEAMGWIAQHAVINPIGGELAEIHEVTQNTAARNDAILKKNPGKRATAQDFSLEGKPWYVRAFGAIAGHDPQASADAINAGLDMRAQRASAPMPPGFGPPAPAPQVTNNTTVNQTIAATTPKEVADAAAAGAKSGTTEGNNLRTMRALVPTG